MERFKFLKKKSVSRIPESTGVYSFKKGRQFLYIGKANNIRERVKNHFKKETFKDSLFTNEANKVGYIKTDSEIEALILEANLIKSKKPKYNIVWRDDKNFFFVGITRPVRRRIKHQNLAHPPLTESKATSGEAGEEELPRVFITHQPRIQNTKHKTQNTRYVGPFVEGSSLKKA